MVSFVLVPPALAQELQKDSLFSEVHALNAAARRARGQYIGRIDQDILVGKRFLEEFFQLHDGAQRLDVPLSRALLFANRRRIPYRFAVRCPPLWAVVRFVQSFGRILWIEQLYPAHLFYFSFVGMWLLHRDLWYECGGYDEKLIYMNEMESDMTARLLHRYKMVNLGKLVDYDFYHLEHYHPLAERCPSSFRKINPELDYERNPPEEFHPNSADWGLARYPLQVLSASGLSDAEAESLKRPSSGWGSFQVMLLWIGAQIAFDQLILTILAGPRWLLGFYRLWAHRAAVAWRTISGQAITTWPRLLVRLWVEKTRPS
jgi:hypothetical protein